jgi:hypothetical protein
MPTPAPRTRVNCVFTWGSWHSCSASCGKGRQVRAAVVSVVPKYGGSSCPPKQDRACRVSQCATEPASLPPPQTDEFDQFSSASMAPVTTSTPVSPPPMSTHAQSSSGSWASWPAAEPAAEHVKIRILLDFRSWQALQSSGSWQANFEWAVASACGMAVYDSTLMGVAPAPSDGRRLRAAYDYDGGAQSSDQSMIVSVGVSVAGPARLRTLLGLLHQQDAWKSKLDHELEKAGSFCACWHAVYWA